MDVCRDVFRVVLELSDGKGAGTVCFLFVLSYITARNQHKNLLTREPDGTLNQKGNSTETSGEEHSGVTVDTELISVLKVYYLDGYPISLDVNENFTIKDICEQLFHDVKVGLYEVEREIGPMQEHKLLPAEMTVGKLIMRWKALNWPDAKLIVPIYLKDWSQKVNHKSVRHVRFENSYLTASPNSSSGRKAIRNGSPSSPNNRTIDVRDGNTSPTSSEGSLSPNMGSAARARTHAFFRTLFVTRDDIDPRENSTSVTEMSWENSLRRNLPNRRQQRRIERSPNQQSPSAGSTGSVGSAVSTPSVSGHSQTSTPAIEVTPPQPLSQSPAVASPVIPVSTPPIAQPSLRESNPTYGHSNSMVNAPIIPQESSPLSLGTQESVPVPSPTQRPIATLVLPQTVSTHAAHDYNSPVVERRAARTPPVSAQSTHTSPGEKVRPRTTYVHLATESHSSRTSSPAHTNSVHTTPVHSGAAVYTDRSPQSASPATTESSVSTLMTTTATPSPLRSGSAGPSMSSVDGDIQAAHARTTALLSRLFRLVEEDHRTENSKNAGDTTSSAPSTAPVSGEKATDITESEGQELREELSPLSMGTVSRSTSPANSVNTLNSGVDSVSPGGSRRRRRIIRSPKPIVRPPFDTSTTAPTLSLLLSLPVTTSSDSAPVDADAKGTEGDDEICAEDTTIETSRTPISSARKPTSTPASYRTPTRTKRPTDESVDSVTSNSARSRRASASVLSNTEATVLSNNNISFSSALRAAGKIRKSSVTPNNTPSTANAKEQTNATPTLKSARSKVSANLPSTPFVTTVRSASTNEPIGSIGIKDSTHMKRFRSPGGGSISGNSRNPSPYSTASNASRDAHHYANSYAQHHPADDRERAGYTSGDVSVHSAHSVHSATHHNNTSTQSLSYLHDAQRTLFEEQRRQNRARSTSPHSAVTAVSTGSAVGGAIGHLRQAGTRRASVQPGRWVP